MHALRQKLVQITGLRRKDMLIIGISLLIGGGIIALNFWQHNAAQNHLTMSYDQEPENMTIEPSDPFGTSWEMSSPGSIDQLTVSMEFRQISEDVGITVFFNGEEIESLTGLSGGQTRQITVPTEDLREKNAVIIDGDFRFTSEASLEQFRVRGISPFQNIAFILLNLVGVIILAGPILLVKYLQYSRRGDMERQFPNFLRDVVEGTRAGMPLPKAIQRTRENSYGYLTPHVQELGAKLEWGIPFEKAVREFGRKTRSPLIQRVINTIIQTYKAGGDVSGVLEAVAKNLKEIRRLRKERQSEIYGQIVTGYIIYFVFLMVLVVLVRYLLPALTFEGGIGPLEGSSLSPDELLSTYRGVFRFLIIIQSVFSGLVIGRLSEGDMKAGTKHVAVLLGIGYTVATIFM